MRVIITRPVEDSDQLADKLRELGHDVLLMPLIKIEPRLNVQIPERPYQLICLTSANGVRYIKTEEHYKKTRVLAVGEHSLQAAHAAGFTNAAAAGGDVVGLHKFIVQNCSPQEGPILYISGAETSGDLEGNLKFSGFDVTRVISYDVVPALLSQHIKNIESADAVMLYSPRSAKIWVSEIERLKLTAVASLLMHYCLSPRVASALPQTALKMIAKHATEADILALLDYQSKAE